MREPRNSILADIQDAIEQAKCGKLALYWQCTIQREYRCKKATPAEQHAYEQLQSILSEVPQRRNTSQKSSIISVKSVWKRCHMDLPGSTNLIQRKASRTSRLRPIIMWARLFFKLPLQHGKIYGIAVPRFASWYPPSIWKAI